ncbi:META domain-containing protein [Rathayibacter iranicus]|uniref:META domain-containing protein n=1 Tax=Rathayibacter iranicus TaxID=59737 RepID=UPI000CE763F4|nr:META domain-containing protein [Rathayibacter iranicus]PPI48153.1 hypothetical protein C5E09_04350 [Rathayibacter iranicus]PPI72687.1 hypothetical protein C5E01_05365 [Rathayibacter iranicus]
MRSRTAGAAGVFTVVALALTGCAGESGTEARSVPAPADLAGRWVTGVAYSAPDVPFLLLAEDGTWTGSDGCNGAKGEWSIDSEGNVSVTAGPSTFIGCGGAALPRIFSESATASLDGGRLRLFDDEGATILKLARSTSEEAPTASADPAGE